MRKVIRGILSFGILLVLVVLAILYLRENLNEFSKLRFVSPEIILFLIVLFIFGYFLIGIVTKKLLSPLGVYLGLFESFALSIVTGFYNLITPFRGGMASRAVYLKKKHNFSYTNFFSSLSASYVIIFFSAGIVGLISSSVIYFEEGIFSPVISLIFAGVSFGLLLIIIFSPRFDEGKGWIFDKFAKVVNGWYLIRKDKKLVFFITIISILQLFLSSLMLYLEFYVFGIEISFIKTLFLSSIGLLGLVIAITPAGLGIQEAVAVFSASTIGISPVESLSAVLLGRVVSVIVLFVLGPIFSWVLMRKRM